jgi:hypothetical protein
VRIRERVAKLERFAGARERPPGAVVIYRGHPCCADLLACANAGHVEIGRGDLGAPVLVLLPDNGRDG